MDDSNQKRSSRDVDILLKECELCTKEAHYMEELVWKTAGLLGVLSLGGIGFLGTSIPERGNHYELMLRFGIIIFSVVIIVLWRKMALRWHSIQRLLYYRILEIEIALNMFKEQYINFLDGNTFNVAINREDIKFKSVQKKFKKGYQTPVVKTVVNLISIILIVMWLLFLCSQILFITVLN